MRWVLRAARDRAPEGGPPGPAEAEPLTFRMTAGSVKTVGRARRADFIVEAPLVSRLHCRLTTDSSGELQVQDLDSTNGTFVNGHRVRRATLRSGDRLGVGRLELTVLNDE
jgi:pSer/pThr/pTyr-binding forkhead associated (FHA) protein